MTLIVRFHCFRVWTVFVSRVPRHLESKMFNNAGSNSQDWSKRFKLYSLTDLFNQTISWLLYEAPNHAAINMRRLVVHKHQPISIARCSAEWTEAMYSDKTCSRFDIAAQDSNPGYLSRVYEAVTTVARKSLVWNVERQTHCFTWLETIKCAVNCVLVCYLPYLGHWWITLHWPSDSYSITYSP